MNLRTNNRKYLILQTDGCEKVGLDHALALLQGATEEAVSLNRSLVISKFSMASIHNLGYCFENIEFKRYINLDKTQVYRVGENGNIQQITSLFHYIDAENFDLNKYSEKEILFIDRNIRPITEEENNRYDVIIRKTTDYDYSHQHPDISVSFYPSDEVEHLTDVVLKTIGTSLADAKKRALIYEGIDFSANQNTFQQRTPNSPLYYAALHIRKNDLYQYRMTDFLYWNRPRNIKRIVGRVVRKGGRIYIMSDIHDRYYFDFLKRDYVVYRYHDFPDLKASVSKNNKHEIDNAMLYSVEKNIFQYAYIKIKRMNATPKIFYIDSSFNVPLLSISSNFINETTFELLRITRKVRRIVSNLRT